MQRFYIFRVFIFCRRSYSNSQWGIEWDSFTTRCDLPCTSLPHLVGTSYDKIIFPDPRTCFPQSLAEILGYFHAHFITSITQFKFRAECRQTISCYHINSAFFRRVGFPFKDMIKYFADSLVLFTGYILQCVIYNATCEKGLYFRFRQFRPEPFGCSI